MKLGLLTGLCFAGLALFGAFTYDDYGVPWDEEISHNYGTHTWKYVFEGDPRLLQSDERYYGPFVELMIVAVERVFRAGTWREIVLVRHAACFGLFLAAIAVFYRLGINYCGGRAWALAGCGLLVLSPRFFSNAFFNSKDAGFACLFVIAVWTLERFLKTPSLIRTVIHAGATAACIATRMPGLMIAGVTAALAAAKIAEDGGWRIARRWRSVALYGALTPVLTLLFWPSIWHDPLSEFVSAFRQSLDFPHGPPIFIFEGMAHSTADVPRRYLLSWIFLTVPLTHLLFAYIGGMELIRTLWAAGPKRVLSHPWIVPFMWVAVPVVLFVIHPPRVYDGWRHYYFLYPGLVLWAVRGIKIIFDTAHAPRVIAFILAILAFAEPAWFMLRAHPHGYAYFNAIAGPRTELVAKYGAPDYWGLSYRQAFERLLKIDPRDGIVVGVINYPGPLNHDFLEPALSSRIKLVRGAADADYRIMNFRIRAIMDVNMQEFLAGCRLIETVHASGIPLAGIHRCD